MKTKTTKKPKPPRRDVAAINKVAVDDGPRLSYPRYLSDEHYTEFYNLWGRARNMTERSSIYLVDGQGLTLVKSSQLIAFLVSNRGRKMRRVLDIEDGRYNYVLVS